MHALLEFGGYNHTNWLYEAAKDFQPFFAALVAFGAGFLAFCAARISARSQYKAATDAVRFKNEAEAKERSRSELIDRVAIIVALQHKLSSIGIRAKRRAVQMKGLIGHLPAGQVGADPNKLNSYLWKDLLAEKPISDLVKIDEFKLTDLRVLLPEDQAEFLLTKTMTIQFDEEYTGIITAMRDPPVIHRGLIETNIDTAHKLAEKSDEAFQNLQQEILKLRPLITAH